MSRRMNRLSQWWWDRQVQRLARGRDIEPGEWLLDLGTPTDRAVKIKAAYDLQNDPKKIVKTRLNSQDGMW